MGRTGGGSLWNKLTQVNQWNLNVIHDVSIRGLQLHNCTIVYNINKRSYSSPCGSSYHFNQVKQLRGRRLKKVAQDPYILATVVQTHRRHKVVYTSDHTSLSGHVDSIQDDFNIGELVIIIPAVCGQAGAGRVG